MYIIVILVFEKFNFIIKQTLFKHNYQSVVKTIFYIYSINRRHIKDILRRITPRLSSKLYAINIDPVPDPARALLHIKSVDNTQPSQIIMRT